MLKSSKDNNENQSVTIIFGVMRQIIGNVFNPQNELCGSIAFGNLTSLEESLAICKGINEEIQANTKHHMQGERFIPIRKIDGNWVEIRGDVLLPVRMNSLGEDEFFVDGVWSVETPPSPTILEFGALRQVSELGDEYELVTSDHEISDILEGVGYKPSSSDDGILLFDGIPSACLFVLQYEGEMKEVWGCYQAAPKLNSGAELIWHDNMSDVELADLEECNPAWSVVYFIGMGGYLPNDSGILTSSNWASLREQIADVFTSQFEDWEDEANQELFDKTLADILSASVPEEIPYLGDYGVYGITFDNWVVGESPTTPSEQEQETEDEKYFSYSVKRTDKKNDEAEAALDEFMNAVNAGDEEALNRIARDAFEPLVYETVPKDEDKEISDEELREFMMLTTSDEDWGKRCDILKKRFNGYYPENWYRVVMMNGVLMALRAMGKVTN